MLRRIVLAFVVAEFIKVSSARFALSATNDAPSPAPSTQAPTSATTIAGQAAWSAGVVSLSCPADTVMTRFPFVNYGRSAFNATTKEYHVTDNCWAISSYPAVFTACYGQQNCSVPASNSFFGMEPCGWDKTLTIVATCTPSVQPGASTTTTVYGFASENGVASLSCPPGEAVNRVDFASYGRSVGDAMSGMFRVFDCAVPTSHMAVWAACYGQQNCTVLAAKSTFGMECAWTQFLSIIATCRAMPPTVNTTVYGFAPLYGSSPLSATLTCPRATSVISALNFANYGHSIYNMTTGAFQTTDCGNQAGSRPPVARLCLGQRTCTVPASNDFFGGEPCGWDKWLAINATCTGPVPPTALPTSAPSHTHQPTRAPTILTAAPSAPSTPAPSRTRAPTGAVSPVPSAQAPRWPTPEPTPPVAVPAGPRGGGKRHQPPGIAGKTREVGNQARMTRKWGTKTARGHVDVAVDVAVDVNLRGATA